MRHEPHDVAVVTAADTRDAADGPVRGAVGVPHHDPAGPFQFAECRLVRGVGALAALQRDDQLLAGFVAPGPRGPRVLHPQPHVARDEAQPGVPGKRAGQQVRLAQDLEAVADAEHRQPSPGRRDEFLHDRREPGDGAAAQVITVGEATGQDHRVGTAQVTVVMPQRNRLRSGIPNGTGRIGVIKRPWKRDNAYPHARRLPGTSPAQRTSGCRAELCRHRPAEVPGSVVTCEV
jgi:hypothetical protein